MDLLDRYLQAVKKHLPAQRQDDIIAELRANMESQLEDKETELGRALTAVEAEAWLKQMGSPVQVAMQYQPQQYLIGPAVFPLYLFVIRAAFLWATAIYAIVNAVVIATQTPTGAALIQAVLRLPSVLMQVATWVTLVFAAGEFAARRYPQKCPQFAGFYANWTPSTLPPVDIAPTPGRKPRSLAQAIVDLVFGFLFLGWLLLVPRHPFLMFGPGAMYLHASPFRLSPAWMTFYWWVVALNVIQLAWRCVDLGRGSWPQPGRAQHIVVKAFGLIPLLLLVNIGDRAYITLRRPMLDGLRYDDTLNSINNAIHLGLLIVSAIAILQLAWDFRQVILLAYRKHEAAR